MSTPNLPLTSGMETDIAARNEDKLLFTPGPLTTSMSVKQAMLHDLGSRDQPFITLVREIRDLLLQAGGVSQQAGYETVLVQGSGTFGVESVLSSAVPKNGKLLILVNGAYGERMAKIAAVHGIPFEVLSCAEDEVPDATKADALLAGGNFRHLAAIHCETTSGVLNPIDQYGELAAKHGLTYIVDSMSAFGAVPVDVAAMQIDYLISSSNKCIEGVPGFSFVIAKKEKLLQCKGRADTLVLDLYAQWAGLENDGQFRFTPPTHALLAFRQALNELAAEGGVQGRATRYQSNYGLLSSGMAAMGFTEYLGPEHRGYIISTYHYPQHPAFDFTDFYHRLNEKGFVIYPGKLTRASCFRVGNIGRLFAQDVNALLAAISEVKTAMGF